MIDYIMDMLIMSPMAERPPQAAGMLALRGVANMPSLIHW